MHVGELPLVVFTITAQMSVGSFIVLGFINVLGARAGRDAVDRVADPALYAIGPVLVAGLIASMLHLGNPLNAINAFRHIESSWLSREIVFGIAFAALGAAFAFCQWFKWFSAGFRQLLAIVTAVVGIGLVWVMSKVYMLQTVPAWNSWATPARFFTTTLLLGALAVGAALSVTAAVKKRRHAEYSLADEGLMLASLRWIAIAAMVLIGVEFVVLPVYLGQLATTAGSAAAASEAALVGGGMGYVIARLALVFVGVGLLGLFLFKLSDERPRTQLLARVVVLAFVLTLSGEVIGRMLFYASYARVGM
ncbi:MAG: dimethyl sulfoxide reductase anchor subunit family protein [Actinomycetes bacterium]